MEIKSIQQRFVTMRRKYKNDDNAIEKRIEVLKRKLDWNEKRKQSLYENEHPYWIAEIIDPIAQLMTKQFTNRYYELLGPLGIGSRTSIHFYKNELKDLNRKEFMNRMAVGDECLSITFIPGDLAKGEIYLEDSLSDTNQFPKGTLGELNGMNHPAVEIPENADEKWLVAWMLEQRK